jgi:general secretion pathway protein A
MYLDFYNLQKAPFHITPDPEFLFLSPSHKAALGCIIHGIEERQGFVAISGEVGLGKTTILRSYLERVDSKQLKTIYIFNANVSFRSLLKTIFGEFGSEAETDDCFEAVNRLHQLLIEAYQQGLNVALIIDEAQNMPVETLENLRMLSNLETNKEKLLQIVMIGQPEFDQKLNLNELRQLKQRIAIRTCIAPLTPEESLAYIQHRLAKASLSHAPVFTKKAMKRIAASAHGTPRVLNILCTNALLAGFGQRQNPIHARTIKRVIADFHRDADVPRRKAKLVFVLGAMVCAALVWAIGSHNPWLDKVISAQYVNGTPRNVQHPAQPSTPLATQPAVKPPQQVRYDEQQRDDQSMPDQPVATSESNIDPIATPPPRLSLNTALMSHVAPQQQPTRQDILQPDASSSLPAETPSAPPQTVFPVVKTVNKDDVVSKLAIEVYGFSNPDVINLLKAHNPQIKNLDRVTVGEKIIFPDLSAYGIAAN